MKRSNRWLALAPLAVCLQLVGCRQIPADEEETKPAVVEHLEGAQPARVTLTEEAVRRVDIQTAAIRDVEIDGTQRVVIPYAAILYDTQGDTWAYTNTEPLTYVRSPIVLDHIVGEMGILTAGPPSGTQVVIVGAAELYGSEIEFDEE
jgi:hypothetical protein